MKHPEHLMAIRDIEGIQNKIEFLLRHGHSPQEIVYLGYTKSLIYRIAQRLHRSGVKVHGYNPHYRQERILHKAHVVLDLVLIAVFIVLIVVILINTFH